jgi:hypothetical protein
LESAASSFSDGDASVRPELAAAGAHAVLPLRAVRHRSPGRVDALLFEIRAGAGEPPPCLAEPRDLDLEEVPFRDAFAGLAARMPALYDPALADEVLTRRVSVRRRGVPTWVLLDDLARAAGIDWAIFQGHALFGRPERLWPAGPPASPVPPTNEERAEARACVAALGSEDPAEREAAAGRLAALGTAAEPALAEGGRGPDRERAARCRDLLAALRSSRSTAPFRSLDPELRRALGGVRVTLRCSYQPVDEFFLRLLLAPARRAHEFRGEPPAGRVFADLSEVPADAALGLICRAFDLDARLEDGRVVVESRRLAVLR